MTDGKIATSRYALPKEATANNLHELSQDQLLVIALSAH
jgi:hypothetical protein